MKFCDDTPDGVLARSNNACWLYDHVSQSQIKARLHKKHHMVDALELTTTGACPLRENEVIATR